MSAPRISASDRAAREAAAARAAGWRAADLEWERLQEAGAAALAAGDAAEASRLWRRARRLAFWRLSRRDPRYATSLANAGAAARLAGREASARRLYLSAAKRWRDILNRIETLEPTARARSSLFHLRMEARHREQYIANQRKRLAAFAAEAEAVLAALAAGRPAPHDLTPRWRGEKPPVFDEARKLLSAALLIATPPG